MPLGKVWRDEEVHGQRVMPDLRHEGDQHVEAGEAADQYVEPRLDRCLLCVGGLDVPQQFTTYQGDVSVTQYKRQQQQRAIQPGVVDRQVGRQACQCAERTGSHQQVDAPVGQGFLPEHPPAEHGRRQCEHRDDHHRPNLCAGNGQARQQTQAKNDRWLASEDGEGGQACQG
ncbi:hypothetical protein D3C78_1444230 [compost metagenome]